MITALAPAKVVEEVDPVDQHSFRQVMGSYPTGVSVVTTLTDHGVRVGLTVSTLTSVSLSPPLILWCVQTRLESAALFVDGRRFKVNVLGNEQEGLARHFATPSTDKFADVETGTCDDGLPVIPGAIALIDCVVQRVHAAGDHNIVIGRVLRLSRESAMPLVVHRGAYLKIEA